MEKLLHDRDWNQVENEFLTQEKYSYVIIDQFFDEQSCKDIRDKLLAHWGWRQQNSVSNFLSNSSLEDIPEISRIAVLVQEKLPNLLGQYDFCEYWATLQNRNAGIPPHADNGAVVLNIWLTPNEYNLEPESGGLLLLDVKRTADMAFNEFNSVTSSQKIYESNTKGEKIKIGYSYNRGIIFDATIFHQTDLIRFVEESIENRRLTLTFVFDFRSIYRARIES